MEYFAGLDVSLENRQRVHRECRISDTLLEKKIAAEPAAIVHLLNSFGSPFKRIGLESGANLVLALWRAACSGSTARSALNAVTSRPG